ncbi:MAG: starch-binding protein [Bacillota bacterium]|nr:starch-binding protein [Bacillota bacterium]
MKRIKILLCTVLSLVLVISLFSIPINITAKAASGDIVYFQAPSTFSSPYCYAWKNSGGAGNQNAAWPGIAMIHVSGNIYSYTLTDSYTSLIFSDKGSSQTTNLTFQGTGKMYVNFNSSWVTYNGQEVTPPPPSKENTVSDASFEQNSSVWTYGGAMTHATDKSNTGSASAKSTLRGKGASVVSQTVTVSPNTDYIYSGYIYRSDNSAWAYIDMSDIAGECQIRDTAFGKWQHVVGVWNSGSNTKVTVRAVCETNWSIISNSYSGVTGDVWFDDISLTVLSYDSYSEIPTSLSSSAQSWSFSNNTMSACVAEDNNSEYITSVTNNSTGQNWINTTAAVPMIQNVSRTPVIWQFTCANVDTSNGKSVTLNYESSSPKLSYQSVWTMNPIGPIYHTAYLTNNSGGNITINTGDANSAAMVLNTPDNITIYRFNRSRMNDGKDLNFTAGVLTTPLTKSLVQMSTIQNSYEVSDGTLPFELLQGNNQGLYLGYDWAYGQMLLQTQNDLSKVKFTAGLGMQTEDVSRANGEKFQIPGVFFGTYSGSADNGSNAMKNWFYNYKMTPTLRNNTNEPLIEFHLPLYSESELKTYINQNDLSTWGVGLTKMDYWWTVPYSSSDANSGFDTYMADSWLPCAQKWPNGMTYSNIVKSKFPNMKVSLYMSDTYQGVDLGTASGRNAEIQALTDRFSNWNIDYWRSDFNVTSPNSYASQEGLSYVLDSMISKFTNFRYESCSAGGALKNFQNFERATFLTMEDSGGALNARMAFYANSYMINPIQLKFDLGFDWSSSQDAANINANPQKWAYYCLRSGMMGAMMVQNVSASLTPVQLAASKDCWNQYNTKQRPILKGADVYHILPMPDGNNWDGMEFYNSNLQKGSVFLFKNSQSGGSDGTSKAIKLQGLDPNATYSLTFQDRTNLNCSVKGSDLMNTGITVSGMASALDSEIIWVTKTENATTLIGDANCDGSVNLKDATIIQKYLAMVSTLTSQGLINADVNHDSAVTLKDATMIQKYLVGLIAFS